MRPYFNPQQGHPAELSAKHMSVLQELAKSLEASQRAIMSGDVALLQRLTSDQSNLCTGICHMMNSLGEQESIPKWASRIDPELLAMQRRVLHLSRVQGALLQRAQQRLRVFSNVLIGAESFYTPAVDNGLINLYPLVARGG